jgi:hypothetical protein
MDRREQKAGHKRAERARRHQEGFVRVEEWVPKGHASRVKAMLRELREKEEKVLETSTHISDDVLDDESGGQDEQD